MGGVETACGQGVVHGLEPRLGQRAVVVELARLPRRARLGVGGGVACRVEGGHRHPVGVHVVGVRVAAGLVVGDDHVRAEGADERHQPPGRLLDGRAGEAVVGQRLAGAGQAGVDVAEEPLPHAEDLAGGGHLGAPDLRKVLPYAGFVHGRVEHVADPACR
jgi:hypothetical protein